MNRREYEPVVSVFQIWYDSFQNMPHMVAFFHLLHFDEERLM